MKKDKGVKEEEVKLPEEPPTSEETTEEVPEVAEETEVETKVETEEETEPVETEPAESGKSANQRIRELNQQKKDAEDKALQAEEKVKSLSERLAEITEPIGLQEQEAPIQHPQYQPGQEISPEQLQKDVTATANAIVELRLKQNNAINRIGNESKDTVRKYSQLDPENENFDKELSETVTEATEAYVRSQPYTASVSKFVDRLMKPYLGSVTKEVGKATENIAKQVSETALRPTSVRKPEKEAMDKTIAELEQELGIVIT
ncbi:MAG: hypothetical protein KJ888_20725 [Gammaproteobacteria bacterium]|nr:hypothetical protein [Gammaproteobacteria bacterium]